MTTRSVRSRPMWVAMGSLCALSLAATTTGCERATPPSQPNATETEPVSEDSASTRSYTVRGQVVLVPDPVNPATELQIHHEHIPDFHGWDGALHINSDGVPGMKSMTMPFPLDDPSVVEGINAGDKVEFTFIVDTDARRFWVSSMTKLDDDAALDYANKSPPVEPDDAP